MKTTTLLFFVFLSLAACGPRDPEVLSAADKANKTGGRARVQLPKGLELVLAELIEGRQIQAQSILKKAQELSASNNKTTRDNCTTSVLTESSQNQKTFQVMNVLCVSKSADSNIEYRNEGILKLQLDNQGQLIALQYETAPLDDFAFSDNQMLVDSKKAKLDIQDETSLMMERTADGNFAVVAMKSRSILKLESREAQARVDFVMKLSGTTDSLLSSEGMVLSWGMTVEGLATPVGVEKFESTKFRLRLETQKESPLLYDFNFIFATSAPRKGVLIFKDEEIELSSKNEKTQKESKSARPRKKSTLMPWSAWL